MQLPFSFLLSASVLLFAVVTAVYFFQEWYAHHKHHPFFLYWGIGVLLLYLLQVPLTAANFGVRLNLAQFSGYFALTIPLSFAGLLFIYVGVRQASGYQLTHWQHLGVLLWFVASMLVFGYFFVLKRGELTNHLVFYLSIFAFFLPLYVLELTATLRWLVALRRCSVCAGAGVAVLMVSGLVGIVARGMLFWRILAYPPRLWFFAANFPALFFMRLAGLALLLTSFILIHRSWHRGYLNIDHPYTLPQKPVAPPPREL